MKHQKIQQAERPYKAKPQKSKSKIATNFAEDYGNTKKWYEELPEDPTDFGKVSEGTLIELKDEAKKCNDTEVAAYNIKNAKTNSDYQWIKTVMSKGTISDKIAAYTVLIQDDPVCNLNTLRNLINMVKVGKKKECLVVMDTLSELFISDLLRPGTKLKPFYDRPLSKLDELTSGSVVAKRKYLSIWFYEDQLKECYTLFVQALNTAAHDSVDSNKEKAINAMYKLLVGNPEQEKNLLANIANKLGDPSQKVASKAIYCLGQVLHEHPNMKQVILNEIERLMFRPNISPKAQYYGVCFLNQFCLSVEDYNVARNLIGVYFAFFKGCIRKGDVDSRMMSALLMGVNRAYPYAKTELTKISEHIDTMYKVVHIATFNVSLHALNLLYQISSANDALNDRFYSALYKKILDPQVGNTTQQALFLNLVFRSLKRDSSACRIRAFIKRLLQVALYMQPPMACGILFLVNQLIYRQNHLLALKSKMDVVDIEEDGEHYSDAQTLENGIDDNGTTDVVASVAEKTLKTNEKVDAPPEVKLEETKPDIEILNLRNPVPGSWFHSKKSIKKEYSHPPATCYTSSQRNPLYAGAEFCVYFELLELQKHYHPTVALYANKLLNGQNIVYSGDPLKDFTLIRFLERFSFKNPKKSDQIRKPGVNPVFGQRKLQTPSGVKAHAVNSTSYLNMNQSRIPVEELFMYTYLQRKQRDRVDKDDDDDESDVDSVGSDEFEEMLSNMTGGKKMEDDDLDFMHEVSETLKNTKTGGKHDSDDEDLDEMDQEDDDDFMDQGNDFGDEDLDDMDENEQGFNTLDNNEENDGDDESEDFDDADSDFDLEEETQSRKPAKKRGKDDFKSIFASADEFASLLDEDNDFMAGTSHAISNTDNSNVKQLNWEQKRNKWVRGVDGAMGKRPKHKQFNKKRAKTQVSGPKNKKQKRF